MIQVEDVRMDALPTSVDDDHSTVQGAQKYQQAWGWSGPGVCRVLLVCATLDLRTMTIEFCIVKLSLSVWPQRWDEDLGCCDRRAEHCQQRGPVHCGHQPRCRQSV